MLAGRGGAARGSVITTWHGMTADGAMQRMCMRSVIWCRCTCTCACRDLVPVGASRGGFNFSLEDKRILNMDNVVSDADNIKQVRPGRAGAGRARTSRGCTAAKLWLWL